MFKSLSYYDQHVPNHRTRVVPPAPNSAIGCSYDIAVPVTGFPIRGSHDSVLVNPKELLAFLVTWGRELTFELEQKDIIAKKWLMRQNFPNFCHGFFRHHVSSLSSSRIFTCSATTRGLSGFV